ncbi:hypothetical protein M902_2037 [Bacteriovorax sp. BAL6_X]|uniref:hypothetical protein n=1 Tax=Bacteriovorax sp. BAL6_X TaxID=1201290 RepID=UPI000385EA1E|nr:hypothetical protein [Bacteriovorax sp. BAL6_X]EPZ52073.1 hypothetical protein M902_2037 [Bacteriovorax sp. BAL6_X]
MKKLALISFALILTFKTFAAEISGIAVSSHVNEFSVVDSKYAREIFLGLPVKNTYADLVHGLVFRYHKYFFCVREPSHKFHCHLYLNGRGEGQLSAFDKDTDFGKGAISEFLGSSKSNGKSTISYDNNTLRIKFDSHLAKRFWNKLDLIAENYHTIGNKKYEVRKGKHLNCYIEKNEKKDIYQCQFNVTIKAVNPKIKIDNNLN